MKCDIIGAQLSGYLDGELTQQESQRVRVHVEGCADCRRLLDDLAGMKRQVGELSYPSEDERMLEQLENDLLATSASRGGWALLLIGLAIVLGIGLYSFFTDPDLPLLVRGFYALFMLGGLGLFGSVLRQRWLSYRNDKYRRVKL